MNTSKITLLALIAAATVAATIALLATAHATMFRSRQRRTAIIALLVPLAAAATPAQLDTDPLGSSAATGYFLGDVDDPNVREPVLAHQFDRRGQDLGSAHPPNGLYAPFLYGLLPRHQSSPPSFQTVIWNGV